MVRWPNMVRLVFGSRPIASADRLQRVSLGAWLELTKRLARTLAALQEAEGGEERDGALIKTRYLEETEALVGRECYSSGG